LTTRKLKKKDVLQLHDLLDQTFLFLKDRYYPSKIIEIFQKQHNIADLEKRVSNPRAVAYGLFIKNELIGFIWGLVSSSGILNGEWAAVNHKYQGKGYFQKLMIAVEKEAKKRGVYKIAFYASVKNIPAIERYLKIGYEIEGTHRNHFNGWDYYSLGKIITTKKWRGSIIKQKNYVSGNDKVN
jgi:ribosomal protein S18 acetylase RimI-like enzyme